MTISASEAGIIMKYPRFLFCSTKCFGTGASENSGRRPDLSASNRLSMAPILYAWLLVFFMPAAIIGVGRASAASDLQLAPGLSFNNDSSPNFPILGRNLAEGSIAPGRATVIFLGTSNCWNTAREAERLVTLYPQFRNHIRFVIVDLHNVGPEQQPLVALYYHGYIPSITAIDSRGTLLYNHAGETASTRGDTANLQRLFESVH